MINEFELEELKELVNKLEESFNIWEYDDIIIDNNIDYKEVKSNIYSIQNEIKEIVERWH